MVTYTQNSLLDNLYSICISIHIIVDQSLHISGMYSFLH